MSVVVLLDVKYFLRSVYFIWEGNKNKKILARFIDECASMLEELGGVNQTTFAVKILHQILLELS